MLPNTMSISLPTHGGSKFGTQLANMSFDVFFDLTRLRCILTTMKKKTEERAKRIVKLGIGLGK